MDMELLHGYGGQKIIDDIIHNYTVSADGNLNAGDLCEFINGQVRKTGYYTSETSIDTPINNVVSNNISSVCLDSKRVLVSYLDSNKYLFSLVLLINKGKITTGKIVQITNVPTSCMSSATLDSKRVIINFMYNTIGAHCIVLTISKAITINVGELTMINNVQLVNETSSVALDDSRVLFCFAQTNYMFCQVISIDKYYNNKITLGTQGTINTVGAPRMYCVAIDSSRVLVSFKHGTNGSLYTSVLTIRPDLSTTNGTMVQSEYVTEVFSVLLDSTHALINYTNGSGYLKSMVVTISNTSISFGTSYQINNVVSSYISSVVLSSTRVLICYKNTSYLYSVVLSINGTAITVGSLTQIVSIDPYYITSVVFNLNQVLLVYKGVDKLLATPIEIDVNNNPSRTLKVHSLIPQIMSCQSVVAGEVGKFLMKGIVKGLTGLIPSKDYYCDDSGNLTIYETNIKIGVAISDTELLIKNALWEREVV